MTAREQLQHVGVFQMEQGGCTATLQAAARLRGEGVFGLPPGDPIQAFPIACLPGAPAGWVREAGSYVIEVDKEHGLWFDWTDNNPYNTAVVPSVKGMNPITRQKIEQLRVEQYHDKCPMHDVAFSHDRFCEKCGYKWPAQNYVAAPNTLWWDGFRQADGTVRQFFFSEDEIRDIASAVIGKENTVPAFGFAFFRPKKQRVIEVCKKYEDVAIYVAQTLSDKHHSGMHKLFDDSYTHVTTTGGGGTKSAGFSPELNVCDSIESCMHTEDELTLNDCGADNSLQGTKCCTLSASAAPRGFTRGVVQTKSAMMFTSAVNKKLFDAAKTEERRVKSVSVGGGAQIRQNLQPDTLAADDWKPEPHAIIRLYFVFKEQMDQILNGGVVSVAGKPEGFMAGLPVG